MGRGWGTFCCSFPGVACSTTGAVQARVSCGSGWALPLLRSRLWEDEVLPLWFVQWRTEINVRSCSSLFHPLCITHWSDQAKLEQSVLATRSVAREPIPRRAMATFSASPMPEFHVLCSSEQTTDLVTQFHDCVRTRVAHLSGTSELTPLNLPVASCSVIEPQPSVLLFARRLQHRRTDIMEQSFQERTTFPFCF